MTLFRSGHFTLHSGAQTDFKIDCDALEWRDWEALARFVAARYSFAEVEGVPEGGLRFARYLNRLTTNGNGLMIVDDVLTTGASMEQQRDGREATGVVIFARGPCPDWVTPIFTLGPAWTG